MESGSLSQPIRVPPVYNLRSSDQRCGVSVPSERVFFKIHATHQINTCWVMAKFDNMVRNALGDSLRSFRFKNNTI